MAQNTPIRRRGLMFVLSSPSGAGKTTISRELLASDANLWMSVSVTTRPMRPGEVAGEDYRFVQKGEFDAMVNNSELLEHARVFDHYYGTPRALVESSLRDGRDGGVSTNFTSSVYGKPGDRGSGAGSQSRQDLP